MNAVPRGALERGIRFLAEAIREAVGGDADVGSVGLTGEQFDLEAFQ